MGERTGEDVNVLDGLNEEDKSRIEGEGGEEKDLQSIAADDQTRTMWEDVNGDAEQPFKKEPSRVRNVFSLVRNQLHLQSAQEVRKCGMIELVHQITRQLDNSRSDEQVEAPMPSVDVTDAQDVAPKESEPETVEVKRDDFTALLLEVLQSVEALRKEVSEEMTRVHQESRTQTEEMLQAMEKRLTDSFRANADKNSLNTVPPLPGVVRRRPLRRTMTTMLMKNTAPTEFRPRCLSEPVRSQAAGGNLNGITNPLRKGAEVQKRLLLPSLTTQQHNNKPPHCKAGHARTTNK